MAEIDAVVVIVVQVRLDTGARYDLLANGPIGDTVPTQGWSTATTTLP
jgi:hypothetical protein